MAKQELVLNIVPINFLKNEVEVHIATWTEGEKFRRGNFTEDASFGDLIKMEIMPFDGSRSITLSRENHFKATKDVIKKIIYAKMQEHGLLVSFDFVGDIVCFEKQTTSRSQGTSLYKRIGLRIIPPKEQFASQRKGWSLLLKYDGETEVYTTKQTSLNLDTTILNYVVCGNEVKRYKWLSETEKQSGDFYPVLNRHIAVSKGLIPNYRREANKYLKHFSETSQFYEKYLSEKVFSFFSILKGGFQLVGESNVTYPESDLNLLRFGEEKTHFNPYSGLKEHGPNKVSNVQNLKFIFVFHAEDRDYANKLYSYLTKGFKGFPGLQQFVGIPLHLDKDKSITFTDAENPVLEIKNKLAEITFDESSHYFAFYISRVKKDDSNQTKRDFYYQIKKLLLEKNIGSQAIYRENITNNNFNYYLPNISIALLAKLGGVPWRLSRPIKHDLVVGVGAFRRDGETFLGTAAAFKNDGTFCNFDAQKVEGTTNLVTFIKDALNTASSMEVDLKRLVVHFYKEMNEEEEKAIIKALATQGVNLPYVVLSITTDSDYIPYDLSFNGKMPVSGTCVKLRNGHYVLCNNTRYSNSVGVKIDDFPLPINIKISKTNGDRISEEDERLLIDQVYQFSRMYWRSIKQKGIPVTVLYSQKFAEFSSHAEGLEQLNNDTVKRSLWFL